MFFLPAFGLCSTVSTSSASTSEDLRRRKLDGHWIEPGDWHWMMDVAVSRPIFARNAIDVAFQIMPSSITPSAQVKSSGYGRKATFGAVPFEVRSGLFLASGALLPLVRACQQIDKGLICTKSGWCDAYSGRTLVILIMGSRCRNYATAAKDAGYMRRKGSCGSSSCLAFFPLPYRTKRGLILFPSSGYGWYMRDDVLAAIAWLEKFVFGLPKGVLRDRTTFEIEEAWIFNPGNDEKPYAFIEPLYEKRRILKEVGDDVGQTAIKLPLNSIYGKTAQSVGENDDKPPPSACPYYAAATTAHCRRKLVEASLLDPSAIVFFATDGIVSERKLEGLPHVKIPGKDRVDLGDWEYAQAESGLFVQAGVYWYGKIVEKDGKRTIKFVSKTRGGNPKKYDKEADVRKWLTDNILPKWEKPFDHRAQITFPKLEKEYQYYITAGSAVASLQRWKVCGRFSKGAKRTIHVHSPGTKRCWNEERPWEYTTGIMAKGTMRQADRCAGLIATLPVPNNDQSLSRMRMPDWLDYDDESVNFLRDQEAIMEGFM